MGWTISKKEVKGEIKYKIWSTVTDSYITPRWLTRDQVIKFLFWDRFTEFMRLVIKDSMTFPFKFFSKEGFILGGDDALKKAYFDFEQKSIDGDTDELFINKFIEEIKKMGISLDIKDEQYNLSTKDV